MDWRYETWRRTGLVLIGLFCVFGLLTVLRPDPAWERGVVTVWLVGAANIIGTRLLRRREGL
jgi:hypothetical protein